MSKCKLPNDKWDSSNVKRQTADWNNIFVTHTIRKGLLPQKCEKNAIKLIKKKKNTQ